MNPILPLQGRINSLSGVARAKSADQNSFQEILQKAQEKESARNKEITFSLHAQNRLQERQINLSHDDLARLQSTVDKLAQKGARESLIYMQDVALVVSVANRTVITALEKLQGTDHIITNIDSAAII